MTLRRALSMVKAIAHSTIVRYWRKCNQFWNELFFELIDFYFDVSFQKSLLNLDKQKRPKTKLNKLKHFFFTSVDCLYCKLLQIKFAYISITIFCTNLSLRTIYYFKAIFMQLPAARFASTTRAIIINFILPLMSFVCASYRFYLSLFKVLLNL